MKNYIYELYKKIKRNYGTNPFEIQKKLNNCVEYSDMGKMYGVYVYKSKKQYVICINNKLEGWELKFTLLHELSHHFLEHKGKVFYNYGYISRQKEEFEADLLATLLFLDSEGLNIRNPKTLNSIVLPERIRYCVEVLVRDL